MAHSRLAWRDLIPGVVVFGVLAATAYAVLRYAQVGGLRGEKMTLYAPVGSARGIMKGTQVWLAGHRVGEVRSVTFAPAATDSLSRVVIRLEVLERHREQFRRDSRAQIRSGGTLVGNPVVYISPGTPSSPVLGDGDSLPTTPQFDTEGITSQVAVASRQFPAIVDNIKVIGVQLRGTRGTAGALLGEGRRELAVVGASVKAVARAVDEGDGTLALALRDAAIMRRVEAVTGSADTLRALLASEKAALGRFRRDSTLQRDVRALLDEVSIVRALLAEPRGTAGRALHDDAVYAQLTQLERELAALMEDLRRRPFRYVVF